MARYLLDTNHLSRAIDRVSPVRTRIREALRAGHVFGTCVPVLCEIEVGIHGHPRADSLRQRLTQVLSEVRVWPIDPETARRYGEIYRSLQEQGRALSQVDMMLAALAIQLNVRVLTSDRDFEALPQIRTENWLT